MKNLVERDQSFLEEVMAELELDQVVAGREFGEEWRRENYRVKACESAWRSCSLAFDKRCSPCMLLLTV